VGFQRSYLIVIGFAVAAGCAASPTRQAAPPSVAPATQPAASLELGAAQIQPMYRRILAVDLPTVTRVAMAQSLDVQEARQRVEASRGRYESSVEAVFPVIAPNIAYQYLHGPNQNANGTLVLTNFSNLLPAVTLQWILNPGRVYYDIVASKRRLEASGQQEQAVLLDTLHAAAVQYYDLVLAQARVTAAQQAVGEAEEALRLTDLRARAGTSLAADTARARAFLAGRRQDLLLAVNVFYQASLALTSTLQLDPTVTLVPGPNQIAQITLVQDELVIEELLATALRYRPDLEAARVLLTAGEADKGAVVWGALGPQVQAAYTYGGLRTDAQGHVFNLREQQRGYVNAGFALGLSSFGQVKTANANLKITAIEVEKQVELVRVQVVGAQQASLTHAGLIPIAREQVEAAEEALRLAQANLKAGTMLLLDVLQAEDELDTARLRFADAVVHYNQSQLNLLASLGLLNAQVISPPSTRPTSGPAPLP
jgi:outer membrane protein TolC